MKQIFKKKHYFIVCNFGALAATYTSMAKKAPGLGHFFGSLQRSKNRPAPSSVGNLFASVAAKRTKDIIEAESVKRSKPSEECPGKDLTMFLVKECKAKHQLQDAEVKKVKRRYNNKKRRALADSRQTSRGAVQRARQDEPRVRALVEKPSCNCSLGTCFSQFLPIFSSLMQLLIFWADQEKVVRDEVLSLCLRSSMCVLGLKVSIACFRVLFKVGKRGVPPADLRLRGQPRLRKCAGQETRARHYLISIYCRLGCSSSRMFETSFKSQTCFFPIARVRVC